MTCMELLAACRARHREIRELEDRLRDAREAITGTSPAGGIRSGGGGDRLAAHAARVDDLETRLIAARRKLAAEQPAVILLTAGMAPAPRHCLRCFYGKGESPARIADKMGCTVSNVHKALAAGRALAARIAEEQVEAALPAAYWAGTIQRNNP